MTAAVITVHWEKGPFNTEGGYELNLTLVAAVFALSGVGPGEWSLDNVVGSTGPEPGGRSSRSAPASSVGSAR
jgi:putative oxidoreductase